MANTELLANAVKEYKIIVKFYKERPDNDFKSPEYDILVRKITGRTDELVGYLLNYFGSEPVTMDDIRLSDNIINGRLITTEDITVELLETIAPGAVPCAMFKRLTWNERLPLDPRKMKNWMGFCKHYASVIPMIPDKNA
jgi:hypothetical protein